MAAVTPSARVVDARAAISANPVWYHTIELAPGIATPGVVDLRGNASEVLPADLTGQRVVDIGTFDGFWAFELEKRGAEVVAVDVEKIDAAEWPPNNRERMLRETAESDIELGRGFKLAHQVLGSSVVRRICPVYELEPERIGGPVDLAFMGALQLHLRDPVRAMEAIFRTLKPGGRILMFEPFSLALTLRSPRVAAAEFQPLVTPFNWWVPNLRGLKALPLTAGFVDVRRHRVRYIKGRGNMRQWCAAVSAMRPKD